MATKMKKTRAKAEEAELKTKKTKKAKAEKVEKPTKAKKTKKSDVEEKPVKAKKTKKAKVEKPVKAKKTKASKKAAKEAPALPKPIKEKMNKTQLIQHLADQTDLDKKDVKRVMEALEETMIASVRKKGLGEFMFPGLFKIVTKRIPKSKGGEKKMSFGREIITKPKPATTRVKIRPMKKVKDAALS